MRNPSRLLALGLIFSFGLSSMIMACHSDYFIEGETQSTKVGKPNGSGKFARAGFGTKAASQ